MRKLVVDGGDYLYATRYGSGRQTFSAYLAEHRRAPLRVYFVVDEQRHVGYPGRGCVYTADAVLNLNTPSVAATIVRRALEQGWTPEAAAKPFVIADGFAEFLG